MIRIQVKSTDTETIDWKDKATKEDRTMKLQTIYVYLTNSNGQVDDTPEKIQTPVNKEPIPVGNYQLSPRNVYLTRERRLALTLNNLTPIKTA